MTQAPVLYGKYQLLERLARGGMAEVFKAKSYGVEGFEKVLVIKRILPKLSRDPRFVEMFINEAKIAVTLTHANIVQVFDLGRVDDTYFIAMEYVAGLDLRTVMRGGRTTGKPISEALAVYIMSELAKALDYAHRRRDAEMRPLSIVHRDVSPENVLVSHEGEIKLTDFGIARARETIQSLGALPPGKYAYIAPEQAREEETGCRADIYALGSMLYEILSGQPSVGKGAPTLLLERARKAEVKPLLELVPDLSKELADIVSRAMAPQADDRYASVSAFYEDLIQYLYSSGRRVGAHDLGDYMEELAEARAANPDEHASSLISGIEEVFQDLEGGKGQSGATPLAVPSSRPPPVAARRGPGTGSWIPRAEWRDVTVLAFAGEDAEAIESLAVRFGGRAFPGGSGVDGVAMLLFGLSETAGRDAHEATRCAMQALRKAPDRSKLRALLHQGRLLLDGDAQPLRDETLANLRSAALAVLAKASWGAVSATAPTGKSLRSRFELDPPSGDAPRRVNRELRADEGVGRFVGRRDELRKVGEMLALCNRGEFHALGIVGDAGVGKSRLLLETARRLRHTGHDIGLYIATCVPQGREIPLSGIAAMLRVILAVEELDSDPQVRLKLGRLRELGLTDTQTEACARVLGLPVEGRNPSGTGTLRSALARIAQKLAEDRLSVFSWDGAEYMDATSQSVLMRTMVTTPRSRVLAVLAYRPNDALSTDLVSAMQELELGPLPPEEVARLVRGLLKTNAIPDSLAREVVLKSGGNPMYVDELVWAMREAGVISVTDSGVDYKPDAAAMELPRTLRGLIASRVGRLSTSHRSILQSAVVVGAQFGPEVLARTAGHDEATVRAALGLLEERRIVRPLSPGLYTFEHELTREVLYEGLPLDARPELHAAVAGALESLRSQTELDQIAGRLAHHHREGGNRAKALMYLVRAAERAEAEHAHDTAIDAYSDAIELIHQDAQPDRDRILTLQARIGEIAFSSGRAEAIADRMGAAVELAESLGRDEFVARFSMMRGRLLNKASRFAEGRQWIERAQAVARKRGDSGLERDVTLAAAEAHARNGEYKAVVECTQRALPLAEQTEDVRAQIRCLLLAAPAYATLGEGELALTALREVRRLVGHNPDRLTECELSRIRSIVLHQAGDQQGMVDSARQAMELAKEYGLDYEYCINAHNLGEYYIRCGDDKRAFAALRSSYEVATEQGFARLVWLNACLLGYLDAMRFESSQGRMRMLQAIQYGEQRGYIWDLLAEKYFLARVDQKRGDLESARKMLRDVIELAEAHGHQRLGDDCERALRSLTAGEQIPLPR